MEKKWIETKFGRAPFEKVKLLRFSVQGLKDRNDAATIQYQLLLKEFIIRCHIEFETGTGSVLYNPLDADAGMVLKAIPSPFSGKVLEEKEVPFEQVLEEGFHLKG
ncbi:MAG: hypothetical protein V1847_01255 [Candidatus Diapherotrites archaeon]